MASTFDSIAPAERIRLASALGKASLELGKAQSPIDKIRAAAAVRALLAQLGSDSAPERAPPRIQIDPTNKDASIQSLRQYLAEGIKSVPEELRPFEQKMVAQLAATLGDRETVNRASAFVQREGREQNQLAAFSAIAARGIDPGVDTAALASKVDDIRGRLKETARASSERVAKANSDLAALNARYRAETSRLAAEAIKAQREGRYVDAEKIQDELDAGRKRYLAEYNAIKEEAEKHVSAVNRSLSGNSGYDELAAEGKQVLSAIMSASKVSERDAKGWAARQQIDASTVAKLKRQGYKEADLRQDMADFYRISGGRIPAIEITSTRGRAHASGITATEGRKLIAVGKRFNRTILFHELAHHIESDEIAKAASNGFLIKRRKSPQVQLLSVLTGNRGYGGSEHAYDDEFLDPYIGKVYRDGVTEVFSMGLQYLATPGDAAMFAAKDPEMFAMVTGYLSQEITPAMQAMLATSTGATTARQEAEASIEDQHGEAVKALAKDISLVSDPAWDLRPGFRHQSTLENRFKNGSKMAYVGTAGNFHIYQGTVRSPASKRWMKGHLVVWDRGGSLDYAGVPGDLDLAKAIVAIAAKTGQSLFSTYFNYIDSGYGDRRKNLIDFVRTNL